MKEYSKAQKLILKFVSSRIPVEEIKEEDIRGMDVMEFYWFAVTHKLSGYENSCYVRMPMPFSRQ